MTYPGNSSLAADVQQRIRSTFEHTLGLAEKGSRQEALLGCDFVLRMDPLFEPARRLQERMEKAGGGPVNVDDLRHPEAAPAGAGSGGGAATDPWADLEGLSHELPELPDLEGGGELGRGMSTPELRREFEALLGDRRFQELQTRAAQASQAVAADLELQRLVALAHERLEAGPYVSKFLLSARDALRAGNTAEANRLLEKAKALDPTHPGIAELTGAPAPAAQPAPMAPMAPLAPMTPLAPAPTAGPLGGGMAPPAAFPAPGPSPASLSYSGAVPAASFPGAAPAASFSGAASAASWPAAPQPVAGPAMPAPGFGDADSERRIQQLIDEGQAALDGGDPQAAIDVWSRIFLIDIDHHEAARRIDQARRLKAERDRQVEEAFHDGLGRLEARDLPAARQAFQRVLQLQPGNLQAREYLQQLDQGVVPVPASGAGRAAAPARAWAASAATAAVATLGPAAAPARPQPVLPAIPPNLAGGVGAGGAADLAGDADLQEEILVPPDLSESGRAEPRREARPGSAAAPEGGARRIFILVGSAVLLLVLAVGWYLYRNREHWFPNSRPEEAAQPALPNPIPRATKLHDTGKVSVALAQLRRVPPGDPHYKEAQSLIAKWQDEQAANTLQGVPGTPDAGALGTGALGAGGAAGSGLAGVAGAAGAGALTLEQQHRASLLDAARKAYQDGTYLLAAERYEGADRIAKLDPGDAGQFLLAKQKLVPIQHLVAMFRGHDWEFALPELWRSHQADPSNKDITRMIVDSYYDLGVRDLQHNDVVKAAEKFTEAKTLAPDDPDLKRQLLFAQTYQDKSADLLFRIYVKYLPIR